MEKLPKIFDENNFFVRYDLCSPPLQSKFKHSKPESDDLVIGGKKISGTKCIYLES